MNVDRYVSRCRELVQDGSCKRVSALASTNDNRLITICLDSHLTPCRAFVTSTAPLVATHVHLSHPNCNPTWQSPPEFAQHWFPQQSLTKKPCLGSTRRFDIYMSICTSRYTSIETYMYIYIYMHMKPARGPQTMFFCQRLLWKSVMCKFRWRLRGMYNPPLH